MIIQMQIMLQQIQLTVKQKFYNLIFVIHRWYHCQNSSANTSSIKNCGSFTKSITGINETTIDDAKNSDLVKPMYNIIEYSSNYYEAVGRLWFYSKNETTN